MDCELARGREAGTKQGSVKRFPGGLPTIFCV